MAGPAHSATTPAAEGPRGLAAQIDHVSRVLCFIALVVSSLAVAAIIIIGTWDTVGRALFNSPMMGGVEMTESLLATVIFLAMPYAQRHGQNVVVDIIIQMFSVRFQVAAYFIALIATLFAFGLLAYQAIDGARAAVEVMEVSAGYVPVPVWIAKILAAFGLVFAGLETLRQIAFTIFWPTEALTHRGASSAEAVSLEHDA
jgi:TRAP-type mannitol/chloroaromatic compound transport system permease small subunit